jgi:hypothetical protein
MFASSHRAFASLIAAGALAASGTAIAGAATDADATHAPSVGHVDSGVQPPSR